jgi:hypothetical protein
MSQERTLQVEALRSACNIMSRDGLTLAQARTALQEASFTLLQNATLVALPGSVEPAYAEIRFDPPMNLEDLVAAFGPGSRAPSLHPESLEITLFYPSCDHPVGPFVSVLVAQHSNGKVQKVCVRRDPAL